MPGYVSLLALPSGSPKRHFEVMPHLDMTASKWDTYPSADCGMRRF